MKTGLTCVCLVFPSGDNNVLLELDASWCSLRQTGAQAMAKAIGDNNKLILLNLSHNSFGNSVVEILIDSLSRNLTLAELNLEENEISARYTSETHRDPKSLINGKEAFVYRLLLAAATNQSLKQFRVISMKKIKIQSQIDFHS